MSLTDTIIRNAKPRANPYKLYDSDGLFLLVTPNGGKWWRLKFRYGGKEKSLSLGIYPSVTLKEARVRRDQERKNIAFNIDPGTNRKAAKLAQTESFKILSKSSHGNGSKSVPKSGLKPIPARLSGDWKLIFSHG